MEMTGWTCSAMGADLAVSEADSIAFRASSLLLDYPGEGDDDVSLVAAAVEELPPGEVRERLARFLDWWGGLTVRDREVSYVETFELGAQVSLYLTSPRPEDRDDRGRNLLRLRDIYLQHGWSFCSGELPDYLPLILEFAALAPQGAELLTAQRDLLVGLERALDNAGSPFAEVVAAVIAVADGVADVSGRSR